MKYDTLVSPQRQRADKLHRIRCMNYARRCKAGIADSKTDYMRRIWRNRMLNSVRDARYWSRMTWQRIA